MSKKKNIFKKPSVIQIVSIKPKKWYQIDITELPLLLRTDSEAKYLLSIIDTFCKYSYNYILNSKKIIK